MAKIRNYKLIYYSEIDGDGEYVVILEEGEDMKEFIETGYKIEGEFDIIGDCHMLPTSTMLSRSF